MSVTPHSFPKGFSSRRFTDSWSWIWQFWRVKWHLSQICQYAASPVTTCCHFTLMPSSPHPPPNPPPPDLQMPRRHHDLPWWVGAARSSGARAVIPVLLTLCESHQLISECPPLSWHHHLTPGWLRGFGQKKRENKGRKTDKGHNA